jgi:hypothetical protein
MVPISSQRISDGVIDRQFLDFVAAYQKSWTVAYTADNDLIVRMDGQDGGGAHSLGGGYA